MNLTLLLFYLLSSTALAQITTITVFITSSATPSTTSDTLTTTSSPTPASEQPTTSSVSTLATSVSATAAAAASSSSSSGYSAENGGGTYNGGTPGSGSTVDTDAGASGSGGSGGSIGKGGLIAIIVVVVVVAIFGITSTILFVLAKRRQWNVRASIARASRRLTTGLRTPAGPRTPRAGGGASNRRTATVSAGRLGVGGDRRDVDTPSYKRGFNVGMRELDAEKGNVVWAGRVPESTRAKEGGWVARMWGNEWK
ncbi:hypothetical protein EJ03DRAFT_378780 [Teratosphaeria nubilosa]|uniref:Mid2 domain-containing protein n=1 Tax=Teratosphaeria nubilosa TaxID=161662 RepID=A0A6G1KV12_9PEZI|nr:hypothetical protein EJ03DRAFT_378780 [Teratosphaeria nubilosa]